MEYDEQHMHPQYFDGPELENDDAYGLATSSKMHSLLDPNIFEGNREEELMQMKKHLKYKNRKMQPRPVVNKDDKRIDVFQLNKEPFLAFQFHVEENGETYKKLQERCRIQARFHYYFKIENFNFARKHAEKKPVDHRKGKKFSCYGCDTFFKTEIELKQHMTSNQHSEIEILYSVLEDVAAEVFLAKNVMGYVMDGSILDCFENGLTVESSESKFMKIWDPKFDIKIDESTFEDIDCEDVPLTEFFEVVHDEILKPLWPDQSAVNGDLEREETEDSWCHYCRVNCGSKENLTQHRTTQEHSDFKTLTSKVNKKICAHWSSKNVQEEEEEEKGIVETRREIFAKYGLDYYKQPNPNDKSKDISRLKRGNPQRDINSGIANKRFHNQPQGPFGDPGYFPGYHEAHMDYQGPPGSFGPPFTQRQPPAPQRFGGLPRPMVRAGGPPRPMVRPGGPPRPMVRRDGPPRPMARPSGPPRPMARPGGPPPMGRYGAPPACPTGPFGGRPPRGQPGPYQFDGPQDGPPMGPYGMPPPRFAPHGMIHQDNWSEHQQRGAVEKKSKDTNSSKGSQSLPKKRSEWQAERNRQRLVKYMEAKNEKSRKEKSQKLAEENKKLSEQNKTLMKELKLVEENKKLAEENRKLMEELMNMKKTE